MDMDTIHRLVWQPETNGGFPLVEVKDQDQDLSVLHDFFPLISSGEAPWTALPCKPTLQLPNSEQGLILDAQGFVSRDAKAPLRAEVSAPPRPFHTTPSTFKALPEYLVEVYSHLESIYSA